MPGRTILRGMVPTLEFGILMMTMGPIRRLALHKGLRVQGLGVQGFRAFRPLVFGKSKFDAIVLAASVRGGRDAIAHEVFSDGHEKMIPRPTRVSARLLNREHEMFTITSRPRLGPFAEDLRQDGGALPCC